MRAAAETTREAAQEMRASMMETRGAIAMLGEEVEVHLSRHLRNFVAQLPGVAPLMATAFNAVAVAGLGMVVFETGKKIYEFAKSLGELSKAEKEHHEQAVKDAKEELNLKVKMVEAQYALLKASAATPEAKQHIQINEDAELAKLSQDYRDRLQADIDDMRKAQEEARRAAAAPVNLMGGAGGAQAAGMIASYQSYTKSGRAEGLEALIEQQRKDLDLADTELAKATAKHNEDMNRLAETGAKAAEAATKKAAAAQMQAWEEEFKREKSLRVLTLEDEFAFWAARINAAEKYPQNFKAVLGKLEEYNAVGLREIEQDWKEHGRLLAEDMNGLAEMSKRVNEKMTSEENRALEAKTRDVVKQMKQHAEFAAGAEGLGGDPQLDYMRAQLDLLNKWKGTAQDTIGLEMARRNLEKDIADLENRQVLASGNALDGLKVFIKEIQTQWVSTGQQVHDVFSRAFDGIGQNMAQMLTTGKANWAGFFQSIESQLAQMAINGMFKMLLGFLNGSDWAGNLFGGSLFGSGGAFGGGRASGGDIDAGHFYLAGESGRPELIGGVNGHVFNADATSQMLGGGGAHYYIDARGANAADVDARVRRSLVAVHGSAVKTAVGGFEEMSRRRVMAPA